MGKITREMAIQFVLMLVVLLGVMFGVDHYRSLQRKAAVGEQRGEVLKNTSAGVQDGITAQEVQSAIDDAINSGRDGYHKSTQEARRNEPETAARDSRAVPASRLRAFAERRRARERSGCAGDERQGDRCPDQAAQR